jgi:hypothetical protein
VAHRGQERRFLPGGLQRQVPGLLHHLGGLDHLGHVDHRSGQTHESALFVDPLAVSVEPAQLAVVGADHPVADPKGLADAGQVSLYSRGHVVPVGWDDRRRHVGPFSADYFLGSVAERCSAARFQVMKMPSRDQLMIASSEDSTTAANRASRARERSWLATPSPRLCGR